MTLVRRLHMLIFVSVSVAACFTYLISNLLFTSTIDELINEQVREVKDSVKTNISIFDRVLVNIEKEWEDELSTKLPEIARQIPADLSDKAQLTQQLNQLKEAFGVSDIHIIDRNLTIIASTYPKEVGLELRQFSDEYTTYLENVIGAGEVATDPLTISINTGQIKRYSYYSEPGSDYIVNADIGVVDRMSQKNYDDLASFVFGSFVDEIVSRHRSVTNVDLFLVTERAQWSLLNSGEELTDKTLATLMDTPSFIRQNKHQFHIYERLVMTAYDSPGYETYLYLAFDFSMQQKLVADLRLYTFLVSAAVILILGWFMHIWMANSVTNRLTRLTQQINRQTTADHLTINIEGTDEIATIAADIKNMVIRLHSSQKEVQALEELSLNDELTSIANRRQLNEILPTEWLSAQRTETDFSLLMVDIDHFKAYNDLYGHAQGDKTLTAVAECLKKALYRPRDLVARYGGEEFTCLAPNTDHQGAKVLAEKLCNNVQALAIPHQKAPPHNLITVSVGCVTINGKYKHVSFSNIIERADKLLYDAKRNGRNCFRSERWEPENTIDSQLTLFDDD